MPLREANPFKTPTTVLTVTTIIIYFTS